MQVELTKEEIDLLMDGLNEANSEYVRRGGGRDFSWEDRFETVMFKLGEVQRKCQQNTNSSM